ncbi:MAG: hypothetical protein IPP11_12065 [Chitinophagaceae bacterium]|nr:hypothetical protein [Chitinophagaceae bacterium]
MKFGTDHLLNLQMTTLSLTNFGQAITQSFSNYKMKWFTETDISVSYDDELLEKLAKSNCVQVLIGFETSTAKRIKEFG